MTVYVDDVRHRYGRMIMCHLWADSLEELLEFVDRLGLARKWIQGHPTLSTTKARKASWVHFDISLTMKAKAISLGAVLTDKYGPVEHVCRMALSNPDPEISSRASQKLGQIELIRARLNGPDVAGG